MNPRIIYQTDAGGVAVIIPAPSQYGIEAIARKDVPAGRPFAIVDASEVPSDRTERARWTVPLEALVDGVGSESNEFEEAGS